MRIIIFGIGAVGGAVAAALSRAGTDVIGIARGDMLTAIQEHGLRLRARDHDFTARFPCVSDPSQITVLPDDMILLTMKSQDTAGALDALEAAGVSEQPIFCLQNGVANERMAQARFSNVHGATVMMPCQYLTPGEVAVSVAPRFGMFDLGLAGGGVDRNDIALAERLDAANFAAFPTSTVMASKYGKLRMNLGNIVQAAIGRGQQALLASDALRAEFDHVMEVARQSWEDVDQVPRRMELIQSVDVPGVSRVGGSTTQSLLRGAGSLETRFLNGEVVQMGLHLGVPAPCNERAVALSEWLISTKARPGQLTPDATTKALLEGGPPLGT